MTLKFTSIDTHIARLESIGDFDTEIAKEYLSKIMPLIEQADRAGKKFNLIFVTSYGKVSADGRHAFSKTNQDHRVGNVAIVDKTSNRIYQILVKFVLVASGRNNIKFFTAEEDALEWIRSFDEAFSSA